MFFLCLPFLKTVIAVSTLSLTVKRYSYTVGHAFCLGSDNIPVYINLFPMVKICILVAFMISFILIWICSAVLPSKFI